MNYIINDIEKLYNSIIAQNGLFNYTLNFDGTSIIIKNQHLNSGWYTFENCEFNCSSLEFIGINNSTTLEFVKCTFNCDVTFENCKLNDLYFENTLSIRSLTLKKGLGANKLNEVDIFRFYNDSELDIKPKLNTYFNFYKLTVNEYFNIENIQQELGKFSFIENKIGRDEQYYSGIIKSFITNGIFIRNIFSSTMRFNTIFNFYQNTRKDLYPNYTRFYKNIFKKVNFSEGESIGLLNFDNCNFNETALFQKIRYNEKNDLKFNACKFEKYALFNNSEFNSLEIIYTHFERKTSFDRVSVQKFNLYQVSFGEAAYFDNFNKTNENYIINWNIETIRAIKRELINTHNQIDYLKYKSYELDIYRRDKKSKLNWKDSVILYFSKESNDFGLDWTKGIIFSFNWSFIFYLLYIVSFFAIEEFNRKPSINEYFVNYLKFANPLSFLKTPFENSENHFFPLLILIIGKIFISFGIYQTIQAFRKYNVR